jgi:hypothetical protein
MRPESGNSQDRFEPIPTTDVGPGRGPARQAPVHAADGGRVRPGGAGTAAGCAHGIGRPGWPELGPFGGAAEPLDLDEQRVEVRDPRGQRLGHGAAGVVLLGFLIPPELAVDGGPAVGAPGPGVADLAAEPGAADVGAPADRLDAQVELLGAVTAPAAAYRGSAS